MNVTRKMLMVVLAAGLGFVYPPAHAAAEESDRATLRRNALEEWYSDNYSSATHGRKKGGQFSRSYRQFLMKTAAVEAARWRELLPSAPDASSPSLGSLDPTAEVAATGTTWTNIGPTKANVTKNGSYTLNVTDTGRPVAIVVDPTDTLTIYVAMAGGGVWKTTDGGSTWMPMTESLGSLSCGALAMDPANSSVLYLGLGDAFDGTGIGLVKSTDGGNTWSSPVYLGDSMVINEITVAPQDSNIVLVATNKGLYRSTNAGASFSVVSLATGQTVAPYAWTIAWGGGSSFAVSLEANYEATSGTTDGQVWTTSDNGATWTKATGMVKTTGVGRIFVASAPSNRQVMYAMAAIPLSSSSADLSDFFKSTNGGRSWTALGVTKKRYKNTNRESSSLSNILNGQGWYNQLVMVDPNNSGVAYFGGALLLAKTTDGGSTYTQITNWLAQFGLPYVHADFHAGTFDANGTTYVGTDGGIFKSTNGGTTWTDTLNIGITSHLLYSVGSSLASTPAVIGGFQDNGTRVRDGSTSTYNQYVGGDGFGSHIHASNAINMLGSLYYTRIQKSTNGGTSFTQSCSGITECGGSNAPFITQIIPWAGDATGNTVFTYVNAKVYKSTNYAGSWGALGTSGLPAAPLYIRGFGVAKTNASVMGIVANSGRLALSNNGGASWTTIASTALPGNGMSLSYIWFDTTDYNTVYVASVAPDSTKNHLWKSTNFGASWTTIDGGGFPFGIPVNIIENDPSNTQTLYAGTHLGVYRSTDGGTTWTRFGAGLPLVNVTDLYISPDSSLVRVSSFGRGFWELIP